jgi:hypothetical protein
MHSEYEQFASQVSRAYFLRMTHADKNLKLIDERLRQIDRQIKVLSAERAKLLSVRGDFALTFDPAGEISPSFRNVMKLQTLGRARELLSQIGHPLSTTGLMSLLKRSSGGSFNPVTVRSHLRRLRMEGELVFDEPGKCWLPPEKLHPNKE